MKLRTRSIKEDELELGLADDLHCSPFHLEFEESQRCEESELSSCSPLELISTS